MYPYTPNMHPPAPTMYPGTPLHLAAARDRLSQHCRRAVAVELAVGLTLVKTRSGICPIQGGILTGLYSDCRLALGLVNRSASNSSLGGYITKIGHGNFTTPCLTVCDLHDVRHQCMSEKWPKWQK